MNEFIDLSAFPDTRVGGYNPLPLAEIQRGLAFHEAAHAVIGMLAGMSLERTRIHTIQRHGATGWTGTTTWNPSFVREFRFAVECAAGAVADLRQLTEAGLDTPATVARTEAPHDRDLAVKTLATTGYTLAMDGPAPDFGTTWQEVLKTAREAVNDHWQQITNVALALLAAPGRELTGDAVAAITGIPNPAPSDPAVRPDQTGA